MHRGIISWCNGFKKQGKIGEDGHPASWVSTSHPSLFAPSVLNGNLALARLTAAAVLMSGQRLKKGITMNNSETRLSRKHVRRLRIPVLPEEEQIIKENAAHAGLATAVYLRRLALGYEIKSSIDQQHIIELSKINADLGRLGGLLKLWLTNDERLAHIEPKTITVVLERIKATQAAMLEVVNKL